MPEIPADWYKKVDAEMLEKWPNLRDALLRDQGTMGKIRRLIYDPATTPGEREAAVLALARLERRATS